MADVKISELASVVGVSVERLLFQIKEAGLPHSGPDESITNEDKNTLLMFLRRGHGDKNATDAAPRKITLKRKTLATLKSAPSHGRSKTVSVEVRKKRTYVKRSSLPGEAQSEAVSAEEIKAPTGDLPEAKVETTGVRAAEEISAKVAAEAVTEAKEVKPGTSKILDVIPAEIPVTTPEHTRGSKPGDKRRGKTDDDDRDEEKKSHLKHREKALRRQVKDRLSPDEFVLQDGEYEQIDSHVRRGGRKHKRADKRHAFEKPTEFISREVAIGEANLVTDLAQKMSVKSGEIVKQLLKMGVVATVNQALDRDTATLLIEEMGNTAKFVSEDVVEETLSEVLAQKEGKVQVSRAPVVTVMGHVDHGKTSLLDYVRKSAVASSEAGGITQHIGAYHVNTDRGMISFLDTPGHAAFSAMRSRGAKATDIVILVVAADDGVKPQTEEAVHHAKAAKVPIVVAVNKIDKQGIDVERVKNELSALEVIPDSWGGDTQFIEVSALTGKGIDDLLEAVLLQAELLELKAFPDVPGRGLVIESRLDKGRGPVATVLVQNGTLRAGDIVLVGHETGRIRALLDESGASVDAAGPSIPVEILGLNGVPEAGDEFVVVEDEKYAREVAAHRAERFKLRQHAMKKAGSLETMFDGIGKEDRKILNVIIKADVRGSLEAISASLQKLGNDEVEVNIVATGVGGFSETDAQLATTSDAMMIGFNVRADKAARDIIEREGLELRYYNVIYNVIDDAKAILSGMLKPELREEILGIAEVRDVFNSPKYGQIAGCMVIEGTVYRSKPIRVLRDNIVIYEGELESLRRFKDDASEVRNGMECGIGVKNYNDVKAGDRIEVYQTNVIARTL
jgi:translation initiation factor IF-2